MRLLRSKVDKIQRREKEAREFASPSGDTVEIGRTRRRRRRDAATRLVGTDDLSYAAPEGPSEARTLYAEAYGEDFFSGFVRAQTALAKRRATNNAKRRA